jgi:hypothetical protein
MPDDAPVIRTMRRGLIDDFRFNNILRCHHPRKRMIR